MGRLFGTNGVRGIANDDMNGALALDLGKAIGTYFGGKAVLAIGTDTRTSREMLKSAVIAGVLSTGANIIDIGIVPSPSLQYYVKTSGHVAAGIIITASHNPPAFNGIKVVDGDGTELPEDKENAIEEHYFSKSFAVADWSQIGAVSCDESANDRYTDAVLGSVDTDAIRAADFTVLYDAANGAGALSNPQLFRKLGCRVIATNAQPDGMFPGHESEPTPENLRDVMAMVAAVGADIGIVNDGDADRAIFIDERGAFIYGDKTLALVAKMMVRENGGGLIVTPVSSSKAIEAVVTAEGGTVAYTRVGAPIVARTMIEQDALFGGEENGGLIFPEHQYCRDGAMGPAKIIEIMAKTGKKLSELVAELPTYAQYKTKVACPNEKKAQVLSAIARDVESLGDVDTTDGVKVTVKNGWILIRPSGTEPIFRIYAEADDAAAVTKLAEEYAARLTVLIGE